MDLNQLKDVVDKHNAILYYSYDSSKQEESLSVESEKGFIRFFPESQHVWSFCKSTKKQDKTTVPVPDHKRPEHVDSFFSKCVSMGNSK